MYAAASFFSRSGLGNWGFRWLHVLAGITWIGLLYYFNFVQVPAFAEFEQHDGGAKARNVALDKLARRALWWFRWAAVATVLTGIVIMGLVDNYFTGGLSNAGISAILMGVLLGLIMFLNVWGVIWRNQKVVLANAANVLGGGQADPSAAASGRRAMMASRTNVIFSVSMLFFMVFRSHAPYSGDVASNATIFWIIGIVVIAVIELNGLAMLPWKATPKKGLNIILETVRNALIAAFGLWAVFLFLSEVFLNS